MAGCSGGPLKGSSGDKVIRDEAMTVQGFVSVKTDRPA